MTSEDRSGGGHPVWGGGRRELSSSSVSDHHLDRGGGAGVLVGLERHRVDVERGKVEGGIFRDFF